MKRGYLWEIANSDSSNCVPPIIAYVLIGFGFSGRIKSVSVKVSVCASFKKFQFDVPFHFDELRHL